MIYLTHKMQQPAGKHYRFDLAPQQNEYQKQYQKQFSINIPREKTEVHNSIHAWKFQLCRSGLKGHNKKRKANANHYFSYDLVQTQLNCFNSPEQRAFCQKYVYCTHLGCCKQHRIQCITLLNQLPYHHSQAFLSFSPTLHQQAQPHPNCQQLLVHLHCLFKIEDRYYRLYQICSAGLIAKQITVTFLSSMCFS